MMKTQCPEADPTSTVHPAKMRASAASSTSAAPGTTRSRYRRAVACVRKTKYSSNPALGSPVDTDHFGTFGFRFDHP